MLQHPPNWLEILKTKAKDLPTLLTRPEVSKHIETANAKYYHWDVFRGIKGPQGLDPKTGWALLKMGRFGNRRNLSMISQQGTPLHFSVLPAHFEILSYIDRYASGTILSSDPLPTEDQQNKFIISGLIEEAISSSQMEGAATTRVVAKEMLETARQPKNDHEKMILNNYKAMKFIETSLARELNDDFLLELHKILTTGTLERDEECGAFRGESDKIVISDPITGEVSHIPPNIQTAKRELKKLYKFANEQQHPYVHPLVVASIIHFQIGHLHPFTDGNGRLARALFLWFVIKQGYWLFKFVPISPVIKRSKASYTRAFEYVETDEGDTTYFVSYQLRVCKAAISEFIEYFKRKQARKIEIRSKLFRDLNLNERQLELIHRLKKQPDMEVDLNSYKRTSQVVYETARKDLFRLVEVQILSVSKRGKKYVFAAGPSLNR